MDAVELNELPSEARRRLSVVLGADAEETVAAMARRRSTVTFRVPHNLEKLADQDDGGDDEGTRGPKLRENRASVVGRRASAFSRVFALSSTSESFMEGNIRPTLINAMIFFKDPKPDINKIRHVLAERLLCIPRFRSIVRQSDDSKVHFDPLPRGAVDFRVHVKEVDGREKYDAEDIEALISDSFLSDWPSDRPLWRGTLVTNLADGRSMLFIVIDHAIGDGVGLLAVFLSLFDDPIEGKSIATAPQKKRKAPSLRWSHLTLAFIRGIYDGIVNTLIPPAPDTPSSITIPKDKLESPCPGKSVAQTRAFPIDEVKTMKKKLAGTTVNDIVLALITMCLRKTFETTGDDIFDKALKGRAKVRCDFPVNMRTSGTAKTGAELGNEIVVASFPFPIDYKDPIDAVWQCKSRIDELKVSPSFHLRKVLSDVLFGHAPDTVLAAKLLDAMNQSTCMISNVAGPTQEATLGGYDIDDLNFTTAFVGGLYFGVLSFKGNLRISAILDDRCLNSVEKLRDCFEGAYEELKGALKDVDEAEPLKMPDMTPPLARCLEVMVYAAIVAVPVWVARQLQK